MSSFLSLADLSLNEQATVGDLSRCPADYRRLLTQMGILPGTVITVTRIAPLGDPVEISVRGYQLSLRKKEAKHIPLTRVNAPTEATP